MKNKLQAFTLIEILVVATIIIVLTTISIASFSTANKSAKDAKRKSDIEAVRQAMVLYKTQEGVYPEHTGVQSKSNFDSISADLITGPASRSYLSPPAPIDPADGTTYFYRGTSTTSTFCLCARVETGKGNRANAACDAAGFGSSGTYYCAKNP